MVCHLPFPRQETGEPIRLYCCPSPASMAAEFPVVLKLKVSGLEQLGHASCGEAEHCAAIGPGNSVQTQPSPHHFRPNMLLTVPSSWEKVGVLVQHKRTV